MTNEKQEWRCDGVGGSQRSGRRDEGFEGRHDGDKKTFLCLCYTLAAARAVGVLGKRPVRDAFCRGNGQLAISVAV